jgi:hypothetical protein
MSALPVVAFDAAEDINREHRFARESAEAAVEHAVRCGELLIAAKARVEHGEWLPWLEKHCPEISDRSARAYMRLHREMGKLDPAKRQRVANLTVREAIRSVAASTGALRRVGSDRLVSLEDRWEQSGGSLYASAKIERREEDRERERWLSRQKTIARQGTIAARVVDDGRWERARTCEELVGGSAAHEKLCYAVRRFFPEFADLRDKRAAAWNELEILRQAYDDAIRRHREVDDELTRAAVQLVDRTLIESGPDSLFSRLADIDPQWQP